MCRGLSVLTHYDAPLRCAIGLYEYMVDSVASLQDKGTIMILDKIDKGRLISSKKVGICSYPQRGHQFITAHLASDTEFVACQRSATHFEASWRTHVWLLALLLWGGNLSAAEPQRISSAKQQSIALHVTRQAPAASTAAKSGADVDEAYVKEVAALPPEQQVAYVIAKLKELNPGFDPKNAQLKHTIRDGQVVRLEIYSSRLKNIAPIRALTGLLFLVCGGYRDSYANKVMYAPLEDLRPLQGLALVGFGCPFSHVDDLSPLNEMKLISFDCWDTPVTDLTPLKGSNLEFVNCPSTKIADFSLFKTMPLKTLKCDVSTAKQAANRSVLESITTLREINKLDTAEFWKQVDSGLTPSADKPKTASAQSPAVTPSPTGKNIAEPNQNLPDPSNSAFVAAIAALPASQQMALVLARLKELNPHFDVAKSNFKLEDGAVVELSFTTVGITNITPLRALKFLKKLTIAPWTAKERGHLTDLAPLSGLPLIQLWCHKNPISNLDPLRGMPLVNLSISGTHVTDLGPLNGSKLSILSCGDTEISDLSPLEGLPLTVLWIQNTKVSNLAPLIRLPLQELCCDFDAKRDAKYLRSIRTLTKINNTAAPSFWTFHHMTAPNFSLGPNVPGGPINSAGRATPLIAIDKMDVWRAGIRGVDTSLGRTEEDLLYLRQHFRANVIRALGDESPLRSREEPHAFIEENWAKLHRLCEMARRVGLYVVIDPHTTPGTKLTITTMPKDALWHDAKYHDLLVETWKRLAKEFKGHPEVIGYDLMNEPYTPTNPRHGSPADWNGLAKRLIKTIREEDIDTPIVVEPNKDWQPNDPKVYQLNDPISGHPKLSKDVSDKRVVFSPHFYDPPHFTHQGLFEWSFTGMGYPGGTFMWGSQSRTLTREWLDNRLQPLVDFARKTKAPIFVGEFGAVRLAAGSDQYVADVIGLFEKYGWSWAYHCYRCANCFDSELGSDPENRQKLSSTPRVEILRKAMADNRLFLTDK